MTFRSVRYDACDNLNILLYDFFMKKKLLLYSAQSFLLQGLRVHHFRDTEAI